MFLQHKNTLSNVKNKIKNLRDGQLMKILAPKKSIVQHPRHRSDSKKTLHLHFIGRVQTQYLPHTN